MNNFQKTLQILNEFDTYDKSWKTDPSIKCPNCGLKRVKINTTNNDKDCQNCHHVWNKDVIEEANDSSAPFTIQSGKKFCKKCGGRWKGTKEEEGKDFAKCCGIRVKKLTKSLDEHMEEIKRITSDKTLTEGVISDVFKKISKAIVKFDTLSPEEEEKLDLMKQMIGEYQKYGKIKTKYLLDKLA